MAFGLKNTTALVERRRAQRESVDVAVVARALTGERIPLTVEVLSTGGFLALAPQAIAKGSLLDVSFPTGRVVRVQVVWIEDGKIGCKFAAAVNLPDLLKSTGERDHPRLERRGFTGLKRDSARVQDDRPAAIDASSPVGGADVGLPSDDIAPDADGEAAWLDQFGWLPIDTCAAVHDGADGYLRPVLLRSGDEWAFGRLSVTGWVDMTASRLGERLSFGPTLWTPVSDNHAAYLSDL